MYRYAYEPSPGFVSGVCSYVIQVDIEKEKNVEWRHRTMHCGEAISKPNPSGKDEDGGMLVTVCCSVEEARRLLVALIERDMIEIARGIYAVSCSGRFSWCFCCM